MNPRTGAIAIIAVVVVLVIAAAVFVSTELRIVGWLTFALVAVTSPLWIGAVVFAQISLQTTARERSLRERYPDAVRFSTVVQRETARQLHDIAAARGLQSGIANSTYATVVIGPDAVRVVTGAADPAERLVVPLRELTGVHRGQTQPPRRPKPTIELEFGTESVSFVPMGAPGWLPRSQPVDAVDERVGQIAAVVPGPR